MEDEIDTLFLNNTQTNTHINTNVVIKELETYSGHSKELLPYTQLIKDKIQVLNLDYELYYIKLERLAKEMESIERENTRLENEILYQTSIYSKLKDLLINLEIKETHFISLETDPLDNVEGVSRIEKALYALYAFLNTFDNNSNKEVYNIRVVNEKKERIYIVLRNFYTRFIQFIKHMLSSSGYSKDLVIHKELYDQMKIYKDVYAYSKKFHDFYAVLCRIYIKHASMLYEKEMENHLSKILFVLNTERDKIEECLGGLLESYRSIIKIEENFLKTMSISNEDKEENEEGNEENKDGKEENEDGKKESNEQYQNSSPNNLNFNTVPIFLTTNKIILRFVYDIYYLSELRTINYLDTTWIQPHPNEIVYSNLQEDLKVLVGGLKKKFIQKELEIKDKEEGLRRFKGCLKECKLKDINSILYNLNKERILRSSSDLLGVIESKKMIEELNLMYYKKEGEDYKKEGEDYNSLNEKIKKKLIEFVYGEEEEGIEGLKKLLEKIKGDEKFKNEIKKQMYQILEETEEDKERLKKVIGI